MTSEENLDALARDAWASEMKEVFKERVFKTRRDAYEKYCRVLVAEEKASSEKRWRSSVCKRHRSESGQGRRH